MPNTETVVIEEVKEDGQWFRIVLKDDARVPSTRDKKLASLAQQSVGTEAEVVIGHQKKGQYDNYYLNGIGGETETRSKTNGSSAPRTRPQGGGGGRNPETQKEIAHQWAVGRALEVFTLTDSSVSLEGLTDEQKAFIASTATFMLEVRDGLK